MSTITHHLSLCGRIHWREEAWVVGGCQPQSYCILPAALTEFPERTGSWGCLPADSFHLEQTGAHLVSRHRELRRAVVSHQSDFPPRTHFMFSKQCSLDKMSKLLTCICDTVVLALSAHVIDHNDPDQRGSDHTAHHHDHHDAHCGPAVLVVPCTRIAVGRGRDTEVDVAALRSQSIRHDAGVFPHIGRTGIYNDE